MVRQLSSDGSLNRDVAAHIMTSVLQALQLHGQHEANLGSLLVLGAQLYEILRPLFPVVIEVCTACAFVNIIINHICVSASLFSVCLHAVSLLWKNRFH
jgi:exportin-5